MEAAGGLVIRQGINGTSVANITTGTTSFNANGGNVTVGTSTAAGRLTIQGVDASSANSGINVTDNTGKSNLIVLNNGNTGINTTTPGFNLTVAGTSLNTGNSLFGGNVGIGMTSGSPAEPLTVISPTSGGFDNAASIQAQAVGSPVASAYTLFKASTLQVVGADNNGNAMGLVGIVQPTTATSGAPLWNLRLLIPIQPN